MKTFLDILLCIIEVFLLLGVLDQIIKLVQDKLTTANVTTAFTGQSTIDTSYSHRLVIIVVEVMVMIVLRQVVLRW